MDPPSERPEETSESSLEYIENMDVDAGSSDSGSNDDSNENLICTLSSSESGIDTMVRSSGDDEENNWTVSNIGNILHSTPKTRPMIRSLVRSIKLKIPPNIIKIDLEKVDAAIDAADSTKENCIKNNKDRIRFIIESANRIDRKSLDSSNDSSTGEKIKNNAKIYVPMAYQGYSNSTFKLEFYHKYASRKDDETGLKPQILHKVRFLHRNDSDAEEIFALPSGSGQSLFTQWADTNFPLSIASATLDEQSVIEKEVKDLYGNYYSTKFKMRTGESLTDTSEFHRKFAPLIYTRFHANINDDNGELKKVLGFYVRSIVKMKVQGESIMFPGLVIDMNKYAELCAKLSSIHNDPNVPRSRKFDSFLSKVNCKNLRAALDNAFLQQLQTFFRTPVGTKSDDVFRKLKDFSIVQSLNRKYFGAKFYYINYKRKVMKMCKERPQLNELHSIVNSKIVTKHFDKFRKEFEAFQISIPATQSGEKSVKEKLINCLEGVFYDDDTEKNYWRVGKDWYQVSDKYSFEVYAEYIRILKTCLLEKRECSLKKLWPLKENRDAPVNGNLEKYLNSRFAREGDYLKLYLDEHNFIVADGVDLNGVEICDLVEFVSVGTSTMRLHFAKKAFGADGYRVAIFQILSSVRYLYDSIQRGDASNDSAAFTLFECINRKRKTATPSFANFKEFLDQLQNATIVFSPLFLSGNREFDKDYMALLKYDFSDIEDQIEVAFRKDLEKELKTFLVEYGYIHPSDGVFTQKWFDACAVINDRGFHVQNGQGYYFDPFPGKKMSNMKSAKLRQILKGKYYKTVDGLSVKQAIVHCAGVLKSMGFGLEICQIEGEGDDLLTDG